MDTSSTQAPVSSQVTEQRALAVSHVLGLPFARLNFEQTVDYVVQSIADQKPGYFITANLNYAMLSHRDKRLSEVNRNAAFLSADGMPIVWLSRLKRMPLPERVAGSDLLPALCKESAERGYRVFLLGAAEGVGLEAAKKLQQKYPKLQIAGVASPHLSNMSAEEEEKLCAQIKDSGAQLIFAALGQPKGEIWIAKNHHRWGNAIAVQVGASIDFAAGRIQRAPSWTHTTGLEWLYRLLQQPRRLTSRYASNALFLFSRGSAELLQFAWNSSTKKQ